MASALDRRLRRLECEMADPAQIGRTFRQIVPHGASKELAIAAARAEGYGQRSGDTLILRTIVPAPGS